MKCFAKTRSFLAAAFLALAVLFPLAGNNAARAEIQGECHVDSRVNAYIDVYINGQYRGTISPWGDIYPWVGDFPGQVTDLYAVARDGRTWRRSVFRSCFNFHWILYP